MTVPLLPAISWEECARALERAGFRRITDLDHALVLAGPGGAQRRGSDHDRPARYRTVRVPKHDVLASETLTDILRAAGLSLTELDDLLCASTTLRWAPAPRAS